MSILFSLKKMQRHMYIHDCLLPLTAAGKSNSSGNHIIEDFESCYEKSVIYVIL